MSWAQGMEVIELGKAKAYLPMRGICTGCANMNEQRLCSDHPACELQGGCDSYQEPIVTLDGNRRGIVEPNGKCLVKTLS
jgi:hypothetical protein